MFVAPLSTVLFSLTAVAHPHDSTSASLLRGSSSSSSTLLQSDTERRRLSCASAVPRFSQNAQNKLANADGVGSAGADLVFGAAKAVVWLYVRQEETEYSDGNDFGCKTAIQ